jgi:hypothetical protein
MLCERRRNEESDFAKDVDYVMELEGWGRQASDLGLLDWCRSLDALWTCLALHNSVVPLRTRRFMEDATGSLLRSGLTSIWGNDSLRGLVERREIDHKGKQARFANQSRLRSFQGQAGTGRMVFRWNLVQQLLNDIADGLGR